MSTDSVTDVVLVSAEGEKVKVPRRVAQLSELIRSMTEGKSSVFCLFVNYRKPVVVVYFY